MHRFSSSEGYEAEPGLVETLRALRQHGARQGFNRLVIGVVTNSDDRVPSILSSLGLRVGPLRYGAPGDLVPQKEDEYDIDFHCMSYDVGVEKPDARIFSAAEAMLCRTIAAQSGTSPSPALDGWQKVYVGDEYAKDVVGAANAGWNPVLLDVDDTAAEVPSLEDCTPESVDDLFAHHPVVRVRSLRSLATWLTGGGV
jgi:FMN phosphatase YigB (HAD superfamily)